MCWLLVWQFWIFFLSLKQQNLMKILFSCIHFPVRPYPSPPPPKKKKRVKTEFYTSKLYGLTGIDCCSQTGIIHSCLWAKSFQLSVFTLYTGPEIERKTACISSVTCNLYTCMQNWELSGVLPMMPNTLWWSQNEVWVKRVHNLVMSSWNKCYCCVITVNDSGQTN